MGSSSDHTKTVLPLLVPPHPSTMQKTLLLVLLVAFVASSSAFHFGLGGIGYGLGYGYGYPYAMGGIGGFGLLSSYWSIWSWRLWSWLRSWLRLRRIQHVWKGLLLDIYNPTSAPC